MIRTEKITDHVHWGSNPKMSAGRQFTNSFETALERHMQANDFSLSMYSKQFKNRRESYGRERADNDD